MTPAGERFGSTRRPTSTTSTRALSYFSHSWQLLNATQLKLLSFPDVEGAAGSRMRPEAAAGFPRVSADGKTYTFTVKRGFKFSDGSNVTAANFRAAIARALNPRMQSPASSFLDDVASYRTIGQYQLEMKLKVSLRTSSPGCRCPSSRRSR